MFLTNLRHGLGLLILTAAIAFLAWGFWPASRNQRQVEIPGNSVQLEGAYPRDDHSLGSLKLIWPAWMRVGSEGRILVNVSPADQTVRELTRQAGKDLDLRLPAEIASESWVIEARLELPEIVTVPAGTIRKSLTAAAPFEFSWKIQPLHSGSFPGTIWLHLIRLPADENGAAQRQLLSAQPVEIRAVKLFGLNTYGIQVIGIVGAVLGMALMLDLLYLQLRKHIQIN